MVRAEDPVRLEVTVAGESLDDVATALRHVEYQVANDLLHSFELSGYGWEAYIHLTKGEGDDGRAGKGTAG